MSASARLRYKIAKCASEDPEYPASELLTHSPETKGWQSARFCDFPQELGLQFDTPVHLRQVQFLSHQSKIATKIELFTALPAPGDNWHYETAQFKRLGYFSLDNNERSQFQARELKSVYVDVSVQFLRILLHKCHVNRLNIVNQVGLVAVNCLGEALGPDLAVGPPAPNPVLAPRDVAALQAPAVKSRTPVPSAPALESAQDVAQSVADDLQFDPRTLERLRSLEKAKQRAVDVEDYDEAKHIKDVINRLRSTGQLIRELEDRKKLAVQNEDFDAAKSLKAEIDRLRAAVDKPHPPVQQQQPLQSQPDSRVPTQQHHQALNGAGRMGHSDLPDFQDRQDLPATPEEGGRPLYDLFGQPSPSAPSNGSAAPDRAPRGSHQPSMVPAQPTPDRPWPLEVGRATPQAPFGSAPRSPTARSPAGAGGSGEDGGYITDFQKDTAPQVLGAPSPLADMASCSMGYPGSPNGRAAIPDRAGAARDTDARPGSGSVAGHSGPPFERARSSGSGGSGATGHDRASHPLKGVPNVDDLQAPEPIPAEKEKDAEEPLAMFGEYIARCICSKSWNLRDAALQKLALDLRQGVHSEKNMSELLSAYVAVLRITLPDRNVQVFLASAGLLQAVCHELGESWRARKAEAQAALDPLLPLLVERLGDANARVEKTTRDALLDFSSCPSLATPFVVQHLLRPLKKKNVHSRVFISRLQLLTALATEAGVQPEHKEGIPLDPTVPLAMEWFGSPTADVRENAVKLVAACFRHVGLPRIERYLASLRPAQREVFDAEFDRVSKTPTSAPSAAGARHRAAEQGGSPKAHVSYSPVAASQPPTSVGTAAPAQRKAGHAEVPPPVPEEPEEDEGEDEEEENICQFCGRMDDAFTSEGLDLHYFQDCPMLTMCEYCQQVIEIPTLRDHWEDEEECKGGAAARTAAAKLPPNHCPLCKANIGAGDDQDWRRHLLVDGCQLNPRDAERELACPSNIR